MNSLLMPAGKRSMIIDHSFTKDCRQDEVPVGTERILLVDDEEGLVLLASRLLEALGYHVSSFTSPEEAFEAFAQAPGDFDLVITDLSMPEMTGLDLAREFSSIRPQTPIIICTGVSEMIEDSTVSALGIRKLVTKPMNRDTLAGVVRTVLDGGG